MKRARPSKAAKSSVPSLPDAELDVLACLWHAGQATARQIRETMAGYRPMAHGSVMTLLKRLQGKALVTREKGPVGKAFIFKPTGKAEPTRRRILKDLVRRTFGGDSVALVSSLFETHPPTEEQLDQLHSLLAELRKSAHRRRERK